MKNLLRLILFAGIMAFAVPPAVIHETITCAPAHYTFRATITSVRDGNWSDPGTWGGQLPGASDQVLIKHTITLDISTDIAGAEVAGELQFQSNTSVLLSSTGNIIVTGRLQSKPANASVIHTIRFTGINENNFQGGGMDPVASDVGMWVMGAGQLDLQGHNRVRWCRPIMGLPAGTNMFTLDTTNLNWQVGDEITIAPTRENDITGFEVRTITAVSGNEIIINEPLTFNHPQVLNWRPEIQNLTSNARIEGTASGRTHVFIRSSKPQKQINVAFRYLGPQKDINGDGIKEIVLGRYGDHLHHCFDGSRGTIIDNCVMRDIGNHAYVPHLSNGVTVRNCVSFNTYYAPFWWDPNPPNASNAIVWENNYIGLVNYNYRAKQVDGDTPEDPVYGAAGFYLGAGDSNVCKRNVAVGIGTNDLRIDNTGAFNWEANNETTPWLFSDNLAHNTTVGTRVWQNTSKEHTVFNFSAYNCNIAIFQGAYGNPYKFDGGSIYNCGYDDEIENRASIVVHAGSGKEGSSRLRISNMVLDGAGKIPVGIRFEGSPLSSAYPLVVQGCQFKNFTQANIANVGGDIEHPVDIINSGNTGFIVTAAGAPMRVQPAVGQPYLVSNSGNTNIPTFAPGIWARGRGLKMELFQGSNFTNKVDEVLDPTINHSEWPTYVWYRITGKAFSASWTGYVQAQFTEQYRFSWSAGPGGSGTLWINNSLVNNGGAVSLEAGQWYPIRFDFSSNGSGDRAASIGLFWQSPSLDKFSWGPEYIPYCQLSTERPAGLPIRDPITNPNIIITSFKVYPIPTTGVFNVESPRGRFEYQVVDIYGRIIEKGILPGNSITPVDITRYADGLYLFGVNGRWWKIIKTK